MPSLEIKKTYSDITSEILGNLIQGGVLTDTYPGSVIRTLVEAFAMEMAEAYARLAVIYEMGFIDTARDKSLDHLVALLGQERVEGSQVIGKAIFKRQEGIFGTIHIPKFTKLFTPVEDTETGALTWTTTKQAELSTEQQEAVVSVQLLGEADGDVVLLEQEELPAVHQIAGINSVVIIGPTVARDYRENDEELRTRVKGLHTSLAGSKQVIEQALLATGHVQNVFIADANTDPVLPPGKLKIMADAEPENRQEILNAIYAAKSPGIVIELVSTQTRDIRINLQLKPAIDNMAKEISEKLKEKVIDTVHKYLTALKVGEKLNWNQLQAKVLNVSGILDIDEGTTITIDNEKINYSRLKGEIPDSVLPQNKLGPMERLTLPADQDSIMVGFITTRIYYARLITQQKPEPQIRTMLYQAFEQLIENLQLAAQTSGQALLSYATVQTIFAETLKEKVIPTFQIHVIDTRQSCEVFLSNAEQRVDFGPEDIIHPHPLGPDWGE